jgi:protein AATF/BFR2
VIDYHLRSCRVSRPSAIRKLHDSISDPKYGGVRTSRSALLDEEDVTSEVEDDATDLEESTPGLSGPDDESTEEEGLEEEDVGSDDEEEDEEVASDDGHDDAPDQDVPPITQATKPTLSSRTPPPPPPPPPAPSDPLSHTLRQKREEDIKKGKAISRQLVRFFISYARITRESFAHYQHFPIRRSGTLFSMHG